MTYHRSATKYVVTIGIIAIAGLCSKSVATANTLSDVPIMDPVAGCTSQSPLMDVQSMMPNGNLVAFNQEDGYAHVFYFKTSFGVTTQIVPPQDWLPSEATAQELVQYGFPARPEDPQQVKGWEDAMLTARTSAPKGFCKGVASSTVSHTANSKNWAGGMSVNGSATASTFTSSGAKWTQPGYSNPCGVPLSNTANSIWTGLGGWNPAGRLIQAGTDNVTTSTSVSGGNYVFYELIKPGSTYSETVFAGSNIPAGHVVYTTVTYSTGSSGTAAMFVEDVTAGYYWQASVVGVQDFYDGTTTDFISESPGGGSGPNGFYWLRQPNSNLTFSYAVSNGSGISHFLSWRINQANQNGTLQNSSFDGADAWYHLWYSCG